MLKTATDYLGVFPIISRINLNLNIPTGKMLHQVNCGIETISVSRI